MFDHVKFGVSDYAGDKAFFLTALEPLGVEAGAEDEPSYGIELCGRNNASLCLYQAAEKLTALHIAFTAETRQQVDVFYRAALEAGGKDNGAAPIIMPNITQPSSSVRMDTILKRCAMRARPNNACKPARAILYKNVPKFCFWLSSEL